MPVALNSLHEVPLFAGLPPDALEWLATTLQPVTFPPGTVLFREGEYGNRFYVILDGTVVVSKAYGLDEEQVLGVRGPGESVGELSLINPDGLRTATVRADSWLQLLELTRADFDALLQRYPAMAFAVLRGLSMRLRNTQEAALRDLHAQNVRLAQAYADLKAAHAQIIEQETLARELHLAREIQGSMLPKQMPQLPGIDLGACMIPARSVGGDFYDVQQIDDERLALTIGDVSGKGVPAALFMALACSLLRAEATRSPPEAALRVVNRQLLAYTTQSMFVTVLYATFHTRTRELTFVRAGHELPLVIDAAGADRSPTRGPGLPLGLFDDPSFDIQTITLPPGGTLLLCTDGLTEMMTEDYEQFGRAGVLATIHANPTASAQQLCDLLLAAGTAHAQGAPQHDDVTMVALRLH